eukprot:gene5622-4041_t
MTTPTRRIQVTIAAAQQRSLTGLFSTFATYGLIEDLEVHRDANYGQCHITVQFQRLSAAERMQEDGVSSPSHWAARFLPPVICAGAAVLLSCSDPFPAAVQALAASSGGQWNEKLPEAPEAAGGSGSGSGKTALEGLALAVEATRGHSVGPHVALLRFAGAPQAHSFLSRHQQELATPGEGHSVAAVYAGPSLLPAVERLLPRLAVDGVAPGDTVRGFVLRKLHDYTCVVDAGVRSPAAVLIGATARALRVCVGDEVEVLLTAAPRPRGPSPAAPRLIWAGTLSRVVGERCRAGVMESRPGEAPRAAQSGGGDRTLGERLHTYAAPLRLYASLVLLVERSDERGVSGRLMTVDGDGASATALGEAVAVTVPRSYLPPGASAVVGERLAASLLYVVAVGGSAATRRCVASRLELDMSRRAAPRTPGAASGPGPGPVLAAGTRLQGSAAVRLSASDIGMPPAEHFPAYLVRPAARSPHAAHELPLLLPAAGPGTAGGVALLDLVVTRVVRSDEEGHYAVVALQRDEPEPAVEDPRAEAQGREEPEPKNDALDAVKRLLAKITEETKTERKRGRDE